jgi:hypothetical protein
MSDKTFLRVQLVQLRQLLDMAETIPSCDLSLKTE